MSRRFKRFRADSYANRPLSRRDRHSLGVSRRIFSGRHFRGPVVDAAQATEMRSVECPLSAKRFYGSGQGFCKARGIEVGFVGVDRPSGASDAPSHDDQSRGAG